MGPGGEPPNLNHASRVAIWHGLMNGFDEWF